MNRVMVLAHREELINQAVGHAECAGLKAGREMGAHRAFREPVVVSTVQTMNAEGKCQFCWGDGCDHCNGKGKVKRMTKFDPWEFGLLVIDEAHHATARTYRNVITYMTQNPDLRVLMVTATPQRSDGVGLHNVADSVALEMDLRTAIDDGWLCPIRQRFITVDSLDLSKVKTKMGGDLADGDLERAWLDGEEEESERKIHAIVKPTIDQANGGQFIIFATGCEHAERITAACNAYDGVQAELVLGSTNKDERRKIVERFKNGTTQGLVNVGVATEGFDCPAAEVISVARMTNSVSLYLQQIGRGTRPLPGIVDCHDTAAARREAIAQSAKPFCVVLDFVGNSGNHKLVSVANVLAGSSVDPIDLETAIEIAQSIGKDEAEPIDMDEVIEKVKQAREKAEQAAREKELKASEYRSERASYTATDVDLFDGASFDPFNDYKPSPLQATQKQVNYLMRLGVRPETATTYSKRQAGAVIKSLTSRRGKDFILDFGKHQGKPLSEVPRSYREWLKGSNRKDVRENIALMEAHKQQLQPEEVPF